MSLPCLLGIVLTAALARADRAIDVEVTDAAPFAASDLAAAMRVRLPPDGPPVRVRVSSTSDGVQVEARGNVRAVPVGELRGAEAARLVALAASDLFLDDLTLIEPSRPARATSIAVLGGAAAWQHTLGGLAIDLSLLRGRWVFALDAGGSQVIDGSMTLSTATLRLGVGARVGMFELRAGPTFAPIFVNDGVGDRTVLVGGGASARLRVPIVDGVRVVVAGGADAFATRTTYIANDMALLTTPRIAPWIAAGVEVTP